MQETKLVVVSLYGNRVEAELAKGALENAGVPAIIKSDTVGRMREHIAWSGAGFQILVREGDAIAAHDVLASPAENDESPDAEPQTDGDSIPPWREFT